MTMIITMTDSLTSLRGQYEDLYDNQMLNPDIIESIVSEFRMSAQWLKGVSLEDAEHEARVLTRTLTFQSEYFKSNEE